MPTDLHPIALATLNAALASILAAIRNHSCQWEHHFGDDVSPLKWLAQLRTRDALT